MPQNWISKHAGYAVMAKFSLVLNSLAVEYGTAFNKVQHLTGTPCFEQFGETRLCIAVKLSALPPCREPAKAHRMPQVLLQVSEQNGSRSSAKCRPKY